MSTKVYQIWIQVNKVKKYRLLKEEFCKGCDTQTAESREGTSKCELNNKKSNR